MSVQISGFGQGSAILNFQIMKDWKNAYFDPVSIINCIFIYINSIIVTIIILNIYIMIDLVLYFFCFGQEIESIHCSVILID